MKLAQTWQAEFYFVFFADVSQLDKTISVCDNDKWVATPRSSNESISTTLKITYLSLI